MTKNIVNNFLKYGNSVILRCRKEEIWIFVTQHKVPSQLIYLKLKFGRFFVRILKRFKSSYDLNFTKQNLICFLARKLRDSNE